MTKLFSYRHAGTGGCNKTAFYTLARPQPGQSLAECVVIKTDGTHAKQIGALMCGHCENGVLGLKIENLKPARNTEMVDLLVKAVNGQTMAMAEVKAVTDNLELLHEACSKIKPSDVSSAYRGSALEASIKEILGIAGSMIVGANGAAMDKSS